MKGLVAVAALVLSLAACGGSGTGSSTSPSPSPVVTTPTPTPTPPPVALVLKLSGVKSTSSGIITVTTEPGSLTVELKITGLQPNSSHVSHIHIGNCLNRGTIKYALKQVVADAEGDADIKTTVKTTYPPKSGTWYVVVHAGKDMQGANSTYLLCGNLFK